MATWTEFIKTPSKPGAKWQDVGAALRIPTKHFSRNPRAIGGTAGASAASLFLMLGRWVPWLRGRSLRSRLEPGSTVYRLIWVQEHEIGIPHCG